MIGVAQTLKDPRRRFAYEFFLVLAGKLSGGESADEALDCLASRDVEAALECWRRAEATGSAVAAHNLAVYNHLQALGGEQVWSAADKTRGVVWKEAFARWHALESNTDLWARVESRLRELDEPQLPLTMVDGMRDGAAAGPQRQRSMPNCSCATPSARTSRGRNGTRLFSTRSIPRSRTARVCSRCAPGRWRRNWKSASPRWSTPPRRRRPTRSTAEIICLIEPVAARAGTGRTILCGHESAYVLELRSSFASALVDRLVLYQRETHDNAACLRWLKRLQGWRLKTELAARIRDIRTVIGDGATAPPFMPEAQELAFVLDAHRLRIDPSGIQFDEIFLPAKEITAFRHGRSPIGQVPVVSTFTVAWWSERGEVVLDAKNFFGREGADETAYARIVAACKRWLCPPSRGMAGGHCARGPSGFY